MPVATPTIPCSATPTFTNWPGSSRAKSSSTPNPRSAVSSTTRLSDLASLANSSIAALRTGDLSQLDQCGGVLVGSHRQAVPLDPSLHAVDPLAPSRPAVD